MGNGAYTLTKEYDDDKFFTEAILDAIKAELEEHLNDVVKNNFDQLKLDLFPSSYVYNDDGLVSQTSPLYNKQTATSSYYSNVNLSTSTDADFTNADATNLVLTFTPEVAGKYLVRMSFNLNVVPTGGAIVAYQSYFRLSDSGVSPQTSVPKSIIMLPKVIDGAFMLPVTLEGIFTFTATSQTIKLQKRNITVTNLGTHQAAGSSAAYGFEAIAIKL